jgi:HEAT repeat protein
MTDASDRNIDELVAALADKDAVKRKQGREALAQLGSSAVPCLLTALGDGQQHVRWEAAKTLTAIADPAAAERLVAALGDEDTDVRWVVGEALIALGPKAVKPLLRSLTKSKLPSGVYQGAQHVLHDLAKHGDLASLLQPVLKAFDELEPEIAVPVAAEKALQSDQA